MPRTALILFAHGARDPQWADPLHRVCAAVREQSPEMRVELAFLEFMKPDLRACAESLVAEHFERILVMPMFIASGGHLKRDVPLLLEELRKHHPRTCFAVAAAIGEAEPVVQAMARHALTLASG
ncbi:MAG: CbiX/SirB N-terminal domain-containing protein [Candidatus Accumulibacter sp.]|uniref:CbiX/SirB N-terminal domain-containing protein n=1 Tax=Candidatus Accumulibacter affinis TaxID=2954384 RepID=A0A935TBB8_9PROT|nr:CbiX/SirB N-terminal domain-containing protein [Candidatus Accumulibacter affinis]